MANISERCVICGLSQYRIDMDGGVVCKFCVNTVHNTKLTFGHTYQAGYDAGLIGFRPKMIMSHDWEEGYRDGCGDRERVQAEA